RPVGGHEGSGPDGRPLQGRGPRRPLDEGRLRDPVRRFRDRRTLTGGDRTAAAGAAEPRTVPFREAFRYWLRLGFVNFGGPAGQIALMHRDLVEKRRWISEQRFLHALSYCMLLPGPEAQQLAIYVGWLLHGTWGGVVAGAFFVLPSIFILWGLSAVYAAYGGVPLVAGAFAGLKPAVVALVLLALVKIGKRALRPRGLALVSAAAFAGIYLLHVPFP